MSTRILIAAAGNVFMGDDGFGPRVIQKLGAERLPDGVKSVDFGVRGMQLLYELANGWDAAILVDTVALGIAHQHALPGAEARRVATHRADVLVA